MLVLNPFNLTERLFHLLGFGSQNVQVRPDQSHHNWIALTGNGFAYTLRQVGLHVREHPRITSYDILDLGERLVVVDLRVNADPVLPEVNPGNFFTEERLPDMGSEISDPGNCPEFIAAFDHYPAFFRNRGSRF